MTTNSNALCSSASNAGAFFARNLLTASALLLLLLLGAGFSSAGAQSLEAQSLEKRAQMLFRDLRCVVCSGQSIAESDALIAVEMREMIRGQLQAGYDEERIVAWLKERYGDAITQMPPFNARTWPLAILPPLFTLLALLGIPAGIWYASKKNKNKSKAPAQTKRQAKRQVKSQVKPQASAAKRARNSSKAS